MSTLSITQIRCIVLIQKNCFIIRGAVGSASRASKKSRRDLKAVSQKPQEVSVFDETDDESINFYRDIDTYLRLRADLDPISDRFFLTISHNARDVRQFWKRH